VAYSFSALVRGEELDLVNIEQPPQGAWLRASPMGVMVGATHRSIGSAIGVLIFSLFWNGIVSVFVAIAIAGTVYNLDLTLPKWFPAPDMNGSPMSAGMTAFLWLFLTPFIGIGAAMIGAFLSSLAGRTEVRIQQNEGIVFNGIGPLGWRRRFDPRAVKDVRISDHTERDSEGYRQTKGHIIIETNDGKTIKCGSMLSEDRRRFVAAAARRMFSSSLPS
jgi:hypothetical protein